MNEPNDVRKQEKTGEHGLNDPGARYMYCIVDLGRDSDPGLVLGQIGLNNETAYLIRYQDVCAVVHRCPPRPYTGDQEQVYAWVEAHQRVNNEAMKQFNVTIPMTFDTILHEDEVDPDGVVVHWLAEVYPKLREKLTRFEGCLEYGVEVLLRVDEVTQHRLRHSPELAKIAAQLAGKPPAVAYLMKQKLQKAVACEIDRYAESTFKEFYSPITAVADDVKVEKPKQTAPGTRMIINASCLLLKKKQPRLRELLDELSSGTPGIEVRLTGPWPPYSFVGQL